MVNIPNTAQPFIKTATRLHHGQSQIWVKAVYSVAMIETDQWHDSVSFEYAKQADVAGDIEPDHQTDVPANVTPMNFLSPTPYADAVLGDIRTSVRLPNAPLPPH